MRNVMRFQIQLQAPYVIGEVQDALLKVIPIAGGTVSGSVNGIILPFGADYNQKKNQVESHVDACYIIQTDTKEYIMVRNQGDIDKRKDGFQETKPTFFADQNSQYAYLMEKDYIGKIVQGSQTEITIELWEVSSDEYR